MITTKNKIRICDDTSRGDSFEMTKVLYEDEKLILCNVINKRHKAELTILIYKKSHEVLSNKLDFYFAENY